ncbi:AzlD domain-containing protein [Marinospirillum sp.]|uniref:AzlD family protein n=1 Tax=Marinospirillum sp. TaxID=2183934 RepID=UPI0028705A20|nr:AzlD domain-containing protein [Marinospirillum sp.]MDR9467153.1 AzlD domain-containing protein [Marinospirillum sp.]
MTLEPTLAGSLLVIAVMTLVTLVTRYGGVFLMSFVPINRRVEGFINGMSGSVLIALILPMAVEGDMAARLSLLSTLLVFLVLRKPLPAIAVGISMAAAWRYFF